MSPRSPHLGLAATVGVAVALAAGAEADARTTILYETSRNHALLTGVQPDGSPGLGVAEGVLQQQPAPRRLGPGAQAWKVSGMGGSRATPSIVGLSGGAAAALLRDRIRRSGAHLVFLDELGSRFRGDPGHRLATALEVLGQQRSPYGGESLARRVHIYVPGVRTMVAAPARWDGAWTALVRAGGVWLETYRGSRPWTEEQWLAWPAAFRREFVRRGGDPSRLHLLLTEGDQDEQWRRARTGAACELLNNGPGAYRLGRGAHDFVRLYRETFAVGAPACLPAPTLDETEARDLAVVLGAVDRGVALGGRRLSSPPLWAGRAARVTVRLGPDPLALARRLGRAPSEHWRRAGARVRAHGAGVATSAPLQADGTAELRIRPTEPGPVSLDLVLPGGPIRRSYGGARDLAGSVRPYAPWIGSGFRRAVLDPGRFRLVVPLRLPGREARSPALGVRTAPGARSAERLRIGLLGPATARRLGLDPRRRRAALMTLRTAEGTPVPGARVAVRLPGGKGLVRATDARGRLVVAFAPRRGVLRATATAARLGARLAVGRATGARPKALRLRPRTGPIVTMG